MSAWSLPQDSPVQTDRLLIAGTGISFHDPQKAIEFGYQGCDMQTELLPPGLKRRTSVATKTAFAAAERACASACITPSELATVFTSSLGEIDVTDRLCTDIGQGNYPLSPTRFHNSVHNTASGYWSIAVGSAHPAMAMSGYEDSFALGLLEAWCQLQSVADQLLLVCYEEIPPGLLIPDHDWFGCAVAFVLTTREGRGSTLSRPRIIQQGDETMQSFKMPTLVAINLLKAVEANATGNIKISPAGATQWFTELTKR
jgi:hypothetical protein